MTNKHMNYKKHNLFVDQEVKLALMTILGQRQDSGIRPKVALMKKIISIYATKATIVFVKLLLTGQSRLLLVVQVIGDMLMEI